MEQDKTRLSTQTDGAGIKVKHEWKRRPSRFLIRNMSNGSILMDYECIKCGYIADGYYSKPSEKFKPSCAEVQMKRALG